MKTYGNLRLENGFWIISDIPPHVAIAFKRLFPQIPVYATTMKLADNDKIRADLQWFMVRYPFRHDCSHLLDEGISRLEEKNSVREEILLPSWTPGELVGFKEDKSPYHYQRQAARIALTNPSLLLADELGLGKTISAIALAAEGAPLPMIVVVQPHLTTQWQRRIEEFSHYTTHVIKGRTVYSLPSADIYIMPYSVVSSWVDVISQGIFKTVTYDEIQELRRGKQSDKGQACVVLSKNAEIKLGLTATPIFNYGEEIFTIMEYIEAGLLGTRDEFVREWCEDINYNGKPRVVKDPDALGYHLRDLGYMLRRTEDDEEVQASLLPPKSVAMPIEWDEDAYAEHEELLYTLAAQVLAKSDDPKENGRVAMELDIRARQATGIAKARGVASYVDMLLEYDGVERILLAGWHRAVYDIWSSALAKYNPVFYTGSETGSRKDKNAQAFINGESRVLMMSLRSGAGLDGLQQVCNQIVIGEFDYSPQVHKQIIGRIRRPGQVEQVTAHYPYVNGGSDPVIMSMLGLKANQSDGILNPGQGAKTVQSDADRIRKLAQSIVNSQKLELKVG